MQDLLLQPTFTDLRDNRAVSSTVPHCRRCPGGAVWVTASAARKDLQRQTTVASIMSHELFGGGTANGLGPPQGYRSSGQHQHHANHVASIQFLAE